MKRTPLHFLGTNSTLILLFLLAVVSSTFAFSGIIEVKPSETNESQTENPLNSSSIEGNSLEKTVQ